MLTSPGAVTTHFYRSPFPRSSDIVHLRAARPLAAADAGAGSVVIMSRPRGYFGLPRDVVLIDGKEPADVKSGVPTDSTSTLRLPAAEVGRPVVTMFNQERIVARAWPAVGEPNCGCGADLLAKWEGPAPLQRRVRRPT